MEGMGESYTVEYIPIETDKVPYNFHIKLGDRTFIFTIKYNAQAELYTVDLKVAATREILCYGDPILYGRQLFNTVEDERFPQPVIIPYCIHGNEDRVTKENLGKTVQLYLHKRKGKRMSLFFIRSASLQIGTNRYSMDDGFYFEFEIPFYDSEELASVSFKIHNLSEATRKSIVKNLPIILNAGYEDDVGVIFVGIINGAFAQLNGTEWIVDISATAVLQEWLNTEINKTYMPGTDAENILRDLLNIFGVEVGRFELKENRIYPRGRICSGKMKDVLKKIVTEECGSRMLVRDNQIMINDPSAAIYSGALLTPNTGLLASQGDNSETLVATPDEAQSTKEEKDEKGETVKIKCLLNHHIGAGDIIQVQSKARSGVYQVISGTHRGSPDGEW